MWMFRAHNFPENCVFVELNLKTERNSFHGRRLKIYKDLNKYRGLFERYSNKAENEDNLFCFVDL